MSSHNEVAESPVNGESSAKDPPLLLEYDVDDDTRGEYCDQGFAKSEPRNTTTAFHFQACFPGNRNCHMNSWACTGPESPPSRTRRGPSGRSRSARLEPPVMLLIPDFGPDCGRVPGGGTLAVLACHPRRLLPGAWEICQHRKPFSTVRPEPPRHGAGARIVTAGFTDSAFSSGPAAWVPRHGRRDAPLSRAMTGCTAGGPTRTATARKRPLQLESRPGYRAART